MTSIPIPIAVAMMLTLLAMSNHHQLNETISGKLFALVIYSYAVSMVFIGLRWSLDLVPLLRISATLAVISTTLLYLAFRSLGQQPAFSFNADWPHLMPAILMVIIPSILPDLTDVILVLIKTGYSVLLIQLARRAPGSLKLTQLDWLRKSELALWGAAILLIFSVLIDIVIALDFIFYEGQHAAPLVGIVNLSGVVLIAWAAVQAGRGRVEDELLPTRGAIENENTDSDNEHDGGVAMLEQLNRLLIEDRLFADTNLNLQKIARKAGVPSRTISRTINAQTNQNLSQWVNNARINAACEALQNENTTVTQAMGDAGFLTKSNFNREFKRVKGCSPSAWRLKKQESSAEKSDG